MLSLLSGVFQGREKRNDSEVRELCNHGDKEQFMKNG